MAEHRVQSSRFLALTIRRSSMAGAAAMLLFLGACSSASDDNGIEKTTTFSHRASSIGESPSRPKVHGSRQVPARKNKPVNQSANYAQPRQTISPADVSISKGVQQGARDKERSEERGKGVSRSPAPTKGPSDRELVESSTTTNPSVASGPSDAELTAE